MRADRLVAMTLLLQQRGRLTAAEAAAELEVSERTARRDLEALGMAGLPVYSLRGRNGGWALAGGGRTDLTGLTETEVRTLFLLVGPSSTATPELRAALRKLVRALPSTFRATAEAASQAIVVDRAAWGADTRTRPDPPHLDAVQRAVVKGRQVILGYRAGDGAVTSRVVHPLGLAVKGTVWYLVAETERGQRTFRVDRMTSVELTDDEVVRPDGFDLGEAWKSIAAEVDERLAPIRARALVDSDIVSLVRWVFGSRIRIGPPDDSGRVEVELRGPSVAALAGEIAGFGARIEVLEPVSIRERLAQLADELGRLYPSGVIEVNKRTDRPVYRPFIGGSFRRTGVRPLTRGGTVAASVSPETSRLTPRRGVAVTAGMTVGLLALVLAPTLAAAKTPAKVPPVTPSYSVTNLGNLGEGATFAAAINATGEITGVSYLPEVITQSPCPKHHTCEFAPEHAFLYANAKLTDLGTLTGTDGTSEATAINDAGVVAGYSTNATGDQAIIDQNGVMTVIGEGAATAINDAGEVAGSTNSFTGGEDAFVYSNGKMTNLGLIPGEGGIFTAAAGINASGEVVGAGDNAASDERAWLYANGKMTDIGTLGGPTAAAAAINDSGAIVGFAQTSSDADAGFLYSGGKMTDLGLNIYPAAINDAGAIVGQMPSGSNEVAFIDSGGKFQNLNTLVPAGSSFTLTQALGINASGQIVVDGTSNTTGVTNAFLLTPT